MAGFCGAYLRDRRSGKATPPPKRVAMPSIVWRARSDLPVGGQRYATEQMCPWRNSSDRQQSWQVFLWTTGGAKTSGVKRGRFQLLDVQKEVTIVVIVWLAKRLIATVGTAIQNG